MRQHQIQLFCGFIFSFWHCICFSIPLPELPLGHYQLDLKSLGTLTVTQLEVRGFDERNPLHRGKSDRLRAENYFCRRIQGEYFRCRKVTRITGLSQLQVDQVKLSWQGFEIAFNELKGPAELTTEGEIYRDWKILGEAVTSRFDELQALTSEYRLTWRTSESSTDGLYKIELSLDSQDQKNFKHTLLLDPHTLLWGIHDQLSQRSHHTGEDGFLNFSFFIPLLQNE